MTAVQSKRNRRGPAYAARTRQRSNPTRSGDEYAAHHRSLKNHGEIKGFDG
jgi:hypothetical protein